MSPASSSSPRRQRHPLHSLPPTETLDLGGGLSLSPRLKLLLTFFRADPAVKPIDEWQLRLALLRFLHSSLSISVPDEDLVLRKRPDLHKRKRDEPVATGALLVRDLAPLLASKRGEDREFSEWRLSVVDRLNEIELNLEGVKFRMTVEVPASDDFELMRRTWEDHYSSQMLDNRNSMRGAARRPDTVVIRGLPCRWLAEPRVSSKPSMLVTHTIFSALGRIRNLNVAGDDDLDKKSEDKGELISGLQCKVWVQFESYDTFSDAMKVLCGRSIQKQGSRLKVDYEVSWDRDGFFRNVQQRTTRNQIQERSAHTQQREGYTKGEDSGHQAHVTRINSDGARLKRFRE